MNIPQSAIEPFGVIGIPMLWCDDPNFNKGTLWKDIEKEFRKLFLKHGIGLSYRVLWEEAAMRCGAEWSAGYANATPEGFLILNVKMPHVRNTQVYQFYAGQE